MKVLVLIVIVAAAGFKYVNSNPTRVRRQSSSSSSASASSSSGNYGDGRIGAGCSGFSCGFQFGDYVAQFPSFGQNYNNGYNGPSGGGFQDQQQGLFSRNGGSNYNNFQPFPDFGFPMFAPIQFAPFQQQSSFNRPYFGPSSSSSSSAISSSQSQPSLGDFARVGNGHGGTSGSTHSSSFHNGIYSESGTRLEPNGRVTSYQAGTGAEPSIQTRMLSPGQNKPIYSSSSVVQQPDGKVTAYRAAGSY